MICLYLYQYLLLWNILYIIRNSLISTFQHKLDHVNTSSHSWDISKQSFYSYWWPDISVVCCCFCTFHICADSPHFGIPSATYFVIISLLVVEFEVCDNDIKIYINSMFISWCTHGICMNNAWTLGQKYLSSVWTTYILYK